MPDFRVPYMNFDLDQAYIELIQVYRFLIAWTFSFTFNGVIYTISLLDFLCSLLVWTTFLDVLFWWKKSNGEDVSEFDEYDLD